MNPDLPQYKDGVEGWSEITLAYDLAPMLFTIPVAIQVLTDSTRSIATGVVVSTEDTFRSGSADNDDPLTSIIYFKDASPITIEWKKTRAVLAMVAIATGEEDND